MCSSVDMGCLACLGLVAHVGNESSGGGGGGARLTGNRLGGVPVVWGSCQYRACRAVVLMVYDQGLGLSCDHSALLKPTHF